eukprot:INCI9412.2.p1 GENE.INCI9412.2~~INCI9412.2.p1  ORF type:complete len:334 (+),score=50.97 INCI9412.2:394-1395(+)
MPADPIFGSNQSESRTAQVDFVLVRNYPRCVHDNDYRAVLMGLNYALVPAVNSLFSIFCATERAILNAELNRLARHHGPAFPFIESYYVDNISDGMSRPPRSYPAVIKVGSSCAGYGKMLVKDEGSFNDLRSILMMGREYYTVEPFCRSHSDVRLTRVGSRCYAFKRLLVNEDEVGGGSTEKEGTKVWKRNTGVTKHVDLPMSAFYLKILDLAAGLFGGLDIVTVDLLALTDGTEVILEINDSASGFDDRHADEDREVLADLVAERMRSEFCNLPEYAKPEPAEGLGDSLKHRPPLAFLADLGKTRTKKNRKKPGAVDTQAAATRTIAQEQAT